MPQKGATCSVGRKVERLAKKGLPVRPCGQPSVSSGWDSSPLFGSFLFFSFYSSAPQRKKEGGGKGRRRQLRQVPLRPGRSRQRSRRCQRGAPTEVVSAKSLQVPPRSPTGRSSGVLPRRCQSAGPSVPRDAAGRCPCSRPGCARSCLAGFAEPKSPWCTAAPPLLRENRGTLRSASCDVQLARGTWDPLPKCLWCTTSRHKVPGRAVPLRSCSRRSPGSRRTSAFV